MTRAGLALAMAACFLACASALRPEDNIVIVKQGDWTERPMWSCPGIDPYTCPDGFTRSTRDDDVQKAKLLLMKVWDRRVIPSLLQCKADCGKAKTLSCAENGKSLAAFPEASQLTVCVQRRTVKGQQSFMHVQGIISYICTGNSRCAIVPVMNRRSCAHVSLALRNVVGAYVASESRNGFGAGAPPSDAQVPNVTVLPLDNRWQRGRIEVVNPQSRVPDLVCPAPFRTDPEPEFGDYVMWAKMAAQLIAQFFVKYELATMRQSNPAYGCQYGAVYNDPVYNYPEFFNAAGQLPAAQYNGSDPYMCMGRGGCPFHLINHCFDRKPTTVKGQTYRMYGHGVISYFCRNADGSINFNPAPGEPYPARYMAVYTAAGTFVSPGGEDYVQQRPQQPAANGSGRRP